MARINSKTNWTASDRPLAPDFNRIESNNEQAFSELDVVNSELDVVNSDLTAETNARISAITAETSARIAADGVLDESIENLNLSKLNNTIDGRIYSFGSLSIADVYVIPNGLYYAFCGSGISIEIRNSLGDWIGSPDGTSLMALSDGSNLRFIGKLGIRTWQLIKIS